MSSLNKTIPDLPQIDDKEMSPIICELIDICTQLKEQIKLKNELIQALKDENAQLKGEKPKPTIKASKLEQKSQEILANRNQISWLQPIDFCSYYEYIQPFQFFTLFIYDHSENGNFVNKRPGSNKRKKVSNLTIHKTIPIPPDNIPEGSRFKGYDDFYVQDLLIQPYNIRYRIERWQTPSGGYVVGQLPQGVAQGHFGNTLVGYILYQYYHAHVTQPLTLEGLLEMGVDISSGQVNRIINENKEPFHNEKDDILLAGLSVSDYVNVDDTGARHKGKNGFCTHIGNELFAWFESTESKSRINFFTLLRGKQTDYILNQDAFEYMKKQKLPKKILLPLENLLGERFTDKSAWYSALDNLDVTGKRHIQIATEGALLGSILDHGFNKDLVIISDDAGQFNVFLHALCWIHAERTINKLVGYNDQQREALSDIRDQIWNFYADLKVYKENFTPEKKVELEKRFDQLFTTKTCFTSLNLALKKIYENKSELLLVLERPEIPLHNNLSENDIREYVKKKKISGGTRSDEGRKCRDTFTSLKKTCRKLNIPFWQYLQDRLSGLNKIPALGDCIRNRSLDPG